MLILLYKWHNRHNIIIHTKYKQQVVYYLATIMVTCVLWNIRRLVLMGGKSILSMILLLTESGCAVMSNWFRKRADNCFRLFMPCPALAPPPRDVFVKGNRLRRTHPHISTAVTNIFSTEFYFLKQGIMRVYFVVVSKYNQIQIKLYSYLDKKCAYFYVIKIELLYAVAVSGNNLSSHLWDACLMPLPYPLWPRPPTSFFRSRTDAGTFNLLPKVTIYSFVQCHLDVYKFWSV